MSWTKIDDAILTNAKMLEAEDACPLVAPLLWFKALVYTNQHKLDGFVPEKMVDRLLGKHKLSRKAAEALVTVGLWHRADGGYVFHNFEKHNASETQREEIARKNREKQAKYREDQRAKAADVTPPVTGYAPGDTPDANREVTGNENGVTPSRARPVPSRPVPSTPSRSDGPDGCHLETTSGPPVRATSNPDAAKILERLRFHRELAHVATVGHAERFAGLLMAGKKLDWLLAAIDDLARAAGSAALANADWSAEVMGNKLQTFGTRAAAPRQDVTPAAGQGRATPHPSGGAYEPRSGFSSVPSEEEIWGPGGKPKEART